MNLEELALPGVDRGPPIKELAGLKRLHTLAIDRYYRGVSEDDLKALREIGLLHALTQAAGKDGIRPKSNGEVLSFAAEGWMTPATIETISIFNNLESLRIRNVGLGEPRKKNKGMKGTQPNDLAERLKELAPFEKLASLDLTTRNDGGLRGYTGVGLAELGNFKRFTSLNLGGCASAQEGSGNWRLSRTSRGSSWPTRR